MRWFRKHKKLQPWEDVSQMLDATSIDAQTKAFLVRGIQQWAIQERIEVLKLITVWDFPEKELQDITAIHRTISQLAVWTKRTQYLVFPGTEKWRSSAFADLYTACEAAAISLRTLINTIQSSKPALTVTKYLKKKQTMDTKLWVFVALLETLRKKQSLTKKEARYIRKKVYSVYISTFHTKLDEAGQEILNRLDVLFPGLSD